MCICVHTCKLWSCNWDVCVQSDGATGWQDGGPSLTGKPEQEEQTPY